jgi:hypothetical protein
MFKTHTACFFNSILDKLLYIASSIDASRTSWIRIQSSFYAWAHFWPIYGPLKIASGILTKLGYRSTHFEKSRATVLVTLLPQVSWLVSLLPKYAKCSYGWVVVSAAYFAFVKCVYVRVDAVECGLWREKKRNWGNVAATGQWSPQQAAGLLIDIVTCHHLSPHISASRVCVPCPGHFLGRKWIADVLQFQWKEFCFCLTSESI